MQARSLARSRNAALCHPRPALTDSHSALPSGRPRAKPEAAICFLCCGGGSTGIFVLLDVLSCVLASCGRSYFPFYPLGRAPRVVRAGKSFERVYWIHSVEKRRTISIKSIYTISPPASIESEIFLPTLSLSLSQGFSRPTDRPTDQSADMWSST